MQDPISIGLLHMVVPRLNDPALENGSKKNGWGWELFRSEVFFQFMYIASVGHFGSRLFQSSFVHVGARPRLTG